MAAVYTIGHSTRSIEEFLAILQAFGVRLLVDVRQYPGSRRHPQFGKEQLADALQDAGIGYVHEVDLGGRRQPAPDSPNTYWHSPQFRGFADYMSSQQFQDALARVIEHAGRQPTAIMCAEAVPWRCHRQLIADALVAHGMEVQHLMSAGKAEPHVLNPRATARPDGSLTYPNGHQAQASLFAEEDA